ncbi:MAG: transcriptional repressor [Bacteroides sp.]|nr:transcriptional repressor [Eubacterium sp.]MCM1418880.1 transcriptional repressor [Roseburia sp.]MCM1463369.1 transcriptional repressor [Bacteroides sp.]
MSGYMTKQRRLLYTFLADHADRRFTAREAADALADRISRSAVYRNLAALEREGLIARSIADGGREIRYRYLRPGDCRERIHLTCTVCGESEHMERELSERLLKRLADEAGFHLDKTRTVLYGVCEKCAPKGEERRT